jgi:proline iminopeptidase
VFLASDPEVAAYLSVLPQAWGESEGASVVEHVRALVEQGDLEAARRWWDYEARVVALAEPGGAGARPPAEELLASVRVQLHFLAHRCFLRPNELLDRLPGLGAMPAIIVQGALDPVCPPATAQAVAQRIRGAELRMVAGGGHSALQAAIAAELCAATARMRDLLTSALKNSAPGP